MFHVRVLRLERMRVSIREVIASRTMPGHVGAVKKDDPSMIRLAEPAAHGSLD